MRIPDQRTPSPDAVQMDIWSYKDSVLQSTQLAAGKPPLFFHDNKYFEAVFHVEGKRVVQLEKKRR